MKKFSSWLMVLFFGVTVVTWGETSMRKAQDKPTKGPGMSIEDGTQKVPFQTSADNQKDLRNSLNDMDEARKRKDAQRKAIARQKAAEVKTKNALKANYGKSAAKAVVTPIPGAVKK
ncbi:MAG TPA: hypothetical protein VHE12_03095 [bacterium]|nr:hypothetical protein [bacterium]